MDGLPTIWITTGICLSIAAVDVANAKGTFRLQGPWPTSSTQNMSGLGDRCRHELLHHVQLRDHQHQVCPVGDRRTSDDH